VAAAARVAADSPLGWREGMAGLRAAVRGAHRRASAASAPGLAPKTCSASASGRANQAGKNGKC
jgi:hypothetical protein